MSTSAFGIEHISKAQDHTAGLAMGSVAAGGLAVGAHVGAKKLPKGMIAHRAGGIIGGLVGKNPVAVGGHLRGALRDAKMIGALKGARAPLALGSAVLGAGAVAGRRKKPPVPVTVSG